MSAHKGPVLAHETLGAWWTEQCTLVSLLFHWPLTVTRLVPVFTPSWETIQLQKTAAELLTVREALETWETLCAPSPLLSPFWKSAPRTTAATNLQMMWIDPVVIKTSLHTPFKSLNCAVWLDQVLPRHMQWTGRTSPTSWRYLTLTTRGRQTFTSVFELCSIQISKSRIMFREREHFLYLCCWIQQ